MRVTRGWVVDQIGGLEPSNGYACQAPRCANESVVNYIGVWLCKGHYSKVLKAVDDERASRRSRRKLKLRRLKLGRRGSERK